MRTATFLLAATLTGLLTGCGGAGPDTPAQGVRAVVVIRWPEPARMVPLLAQSIVLEVVQTGTFSSSQSVERPAAGGTSEVRLGNLPAGTLRFTATAYPEPDGQGVAQATATQTLTGAAGDVLEVRLTMASTVTEFRLSGSGLSSGSPAGQYTLQLTQGASVDVTAGARDADGYTVLVPAATWTVTSGAGCASTAAGTGGATSVKGDASGTTVFSVVSQQTAGGDPLTAQLTVTVIAAPTLKLELPVNPVYLKDSAVFRATATWDPSTAGLGPYFWVDLDRDGDGVPEESKMVNYGGGISTDAIEIVTSYESLGVGTYTAKAWFFDGAGQKAEAQVVVTVATSGVDVTIE